MADERDEAAPAALATAAKEDGYTLGGVMGDLLEEDAPAPPEAEPEVEPGDGEGDGEGKPAARPSLPVASDDPLPKWVKVPKGLKFPRGRRAVFCFFLAQLTDAPVLGDRQAILWSLTPEDEKMAFSRAQGDANRAAHELAKQMLRAIDGHQADWTGTNVPGNVDVFWRQLGGKYRDLIIRVYSQLHILTKAETDNFFENCVAVRSTA